MKGVLLVAHGSREVSAKEEFSRLVHMLRPMLGDCILESAFLQFSPKTIYRSLEALDTLGVDEVILIPYFLFEGTHSREHIPLQVAEFLKSHSHMRVEIGGVLGADGDLAHILFKRISGMINKN